MKAKEGEVVLEGEGVELGVCYHDRHLPVLKQNITLFTMHKFVYALSAKQKGEMVLFCAYDLLCISTGTAVIKYSKVT